MGKNINDSSMCSGLFGKTRQAVLSLLYGHADSSFYTKQVMDAVKTGRGAVQRELKNLTDSGIIIREVHGRQVYYKANENCPIFDELKSLITKPDTVLSRRINIPEVQLDEFCSRHHISKLALFGSVLRDDFGPESDIDVLVEFESGHTPGFSIISIENELSQLIGRKVDLRTPRDLSRYFRDRVVREAKAIYVRS